MRKSGAKTGRCKALSRGADGERDRRGRENRSERLDFCGARRAGRWVIGKKTGAERRTAGRAAATEGARNMTRLAAAWTIPKGDSDAAARVGGYPPRGGEKRFEGTHQGSPALEKNAGKCSKMICISISLCNVSKDFQLLRCDDSSHGAVSGSIKQAR